MNCIEVEERLEGYLQQNLGKAEAAAVARHLQTCTACCRSLALERELRSLDGIDPAPAAITLTEVQRRRETETAEERLGRIVRLRRAAADALVFRALVDPWLQLEHPLRISLLSARQTLTSPFTLLGVCLTGVAVDLGQRLADPLQLVGRTIRIPIALHAR